ncbi:MAG: transcription antitermination factor NusB [Gemmatimonadota bacterium]
MTEGARLPRSERLDRSRARAWILQVHYRWESEAGEGTLLDALEETIDTRRVARRRIPYIREVLGLMDEHLAEIDSALRRSLENWRLDRLAAMDRAVLRIGATELMYVEEVPPKVAIQEAIHLAEAYGGDESPSFVNGVLDALYKRAAAGA